MFIVTNFTDTGEYTPSKLNTMEEATNWLYECTANNIRSWKGEKLPRTDMSNEEVLEWANDNLDGFEYDEYGTHIEYGDGAFQEMNVYDLDNI